MADGLARWHERGEASADLAFWREHLEPFRSPKAFALVVETLLRKADYRAALGLLVNWLSQAEQVPLEDGVYSFHTLALRWMLAVTSARRREAERQRPEAWPRADRRFFDLSGGQRRGLLAGAGAGTGGTGASEEDEEDDLFGAAYEDVTYQDTTDDERRAGGRRRRRRGVRPGSRKASGWRNGCISCPRWPGCGRSRPGATPDGTPTAERDEVLARWLTAARDNRGRLLALLDAVHAIRCREPTGRLRFAGRIRPPPRAQGATAARHHRHLPGYVAGRQRPARGAARRRPRAARQRHRLALLGPWEPFAIRLEQPPFGGATRPRCEPCCPRSCDIFREEPLLFTPLTEGGDPR